MPDLLDGMKFLLIWFLKSKQLFDNIRTHKVNGGANNGTYGR